MFFYKNSVKNYQEFIKRIKSYLKNERLNLAFSINFIQLFVDVHCHY